MNSPSSEPGRRGRGRARPWTKQEQQTLFRAYFDRLPGTCPVCSHEVGMMLEHKNGKPVLNLRCRACGNFATVTG